jgi:hypothetical protein
MQPFIRINLLVVEFLRACQPFERLNQVQLQCRTAPSIANVPVDLIGYAVHI